jgi:predicted DNA-binding transcriptional regulator YafY
MIGGSARLLLLLSLLQSRRDWSGAELAARLDVTPRTLRRDVDRLRTLGYPVVATPGVAGGYRLGAGGTLPPLLLDDDEAVAVALSLSTAATGGVAGIAETAVRALAKVDRLLPPRLRERVAAVRASTVPLPPAGPTVDATVLTTIAGCCRDSEGLRFGYTRADATTSARTVEPHRLVHTGRRWYLMARDGTEWRTFRVDRMASVEPTGRRFVPHTDAPDPAAYVSAAVSAAPYPYRARIRMHAPASVISERVPPTVAVVEPLDADSCLLTTGAYSLDALAVHLATLDVDFTVLDPPALAERLHRLSERLSRA